MEGSKVSAVGAQEGSACSAWSGSFLEQLLFPEGLGPGQLGPVTQFLDSP